MKKIFFLCFSLTIAQQSFMAQNQFTPEKLWELGRVSLEDASPDGKWLLYSVRHYNVTENTGNAKLFKLNVEEDKATLLLDSYGDNAVFVPNSDQIAYLKDGKMWTCNGDGSKQNQLTESDVNGFKFAPTGDKVLFIKDVKYDDTVVNQYPDLPKAEARIIDDLMYRHWKSWHDYEYSNIFFAKFKDGKLDGKAKNIMPEPFDSPLNPFGGLEQIAWHPQGTMVAYTCKKMKGKEWTTSTNSDIYLYNISTGETTNMTKGMNGYDMEPTFSSDGKYLAWNSMARDGFESDRNRIFTYNFKNQMVKERTVGFDKSANHPLFTSDNNSIIYSASTDATIQLFVLDLDTGKDMQITKGVHNYYGYKMLDSRYLVASRASMSAPHELYRVEIRNGQTKQLTHINDKLLSSVKMGEVKKRMVKTTDGKDMFTWVIYPPGFDPNKQYPTLLYCQGGPQSTVSQFWSYRWNFQLMAAAGYIVVAPNRRGLPGFGREWNDAISKDWSGQAMKDYLSAIDDVAKEPYVNKDKLGAVGASYGGYSVYWLAGNHDKRFKAFISHCGLFNLESWYGTTEELFFANWDIGGPYWEAEHKAGYKQHSPHEYVQNWDTPILVIHGGRDFRVPLAEGMQAFQAAQLMGLESRFLYFPDEGHWVQQPQNGLLWHREFFGWLDKYLK